MRTLLFCLAGFLLIGRAGAQTGYFRDQLAQFLSDTSRKVNFKAVEYNPLYRSDGSLRQDLAERLSDTAQNRLPSDSSCVVHVKSFWPYKVNLYLNDSLLMAGLPASTFPGFFEKKHSTEYTFRLDHGGSFFLLNYASVNSDRYDLRWRRSETIVLTPGYSYFIVIRPVVRGVGISTSLYSRNMFVPLRIVHYFRVLSKAAFEQDY